MRGNGPLLRRVGTAEAAIEDDAGDRACRAADSGCEQAEPEPGEITHTQGWNGHTCRTRGSKPKREREERTTPADGDSANSPGEQPDNTPAEEEEQDKGKAGFPDHDYSVRRVEAGVKSAWAFDCALSRESGRKNVINRLPILFRCK
jgi:hypothetical protein